MFLGYTAGVYDLFHIGHLKLLQRAAALCDRLIVGVSTDELAAQYKGKRPIIPFSERLQIIEALRCVDVVVPQQSMDKFSAWERLRFDAIFVGDDWYASEKWKSWEERFASVNVKIHYLPYTQETSSSLRREMLDPDTPTC